MKFRNYCFQFMIFVLSFSFYRKLFNIMLKCESFIYRTQQTFQRSFNVVFWLMWRRDVGQRQINVETTSCISTLKCATSNNVESSLCISTLTWTALENVGTTLLFSTSSFTTLANVETMLWKWPLLKRTKKN